VLADLDPEDTIAAVASAPGPGLRGIVRLSGPNAWTIALAGFEAESDFPFPRRAEVRRGAIQLSGLRPLLPVLVALWPAPRTYTGQNVAEIHTTGAAPLLDLLLGDCLRRGARHAQPGEFTLRAFLCGRIDLTRAEAVLGVIDAQNPAQLDAALRQLAGGLSGPLRALRDRLLDLVAHLEANLDFVDEADVDPLHRGLLAEELADTSGDLTALALRLAGRDRPGRAPRVVLTGPPNAGKSRLFNALIHADQAIVAPQAGTTRDYLRASCDCSGITVELIDTAGVENPADAVSAQAQSLRTEQTGGADLVLLCSSAERGAVAANVSIGSQPVLRLWTKCDLGLPSSWSTDDALLTSAKTGMGVDELRSAIARKLGSREAEGDLPATTAARCGDSIDRAAAALDGASRSLRSGAFEELVAFDLRLAIDELGKVLGVVVTDDILDRIFQRFCIGK
jgi:tRNA modification GTPase